MSRSDLVQFVNELNENASLRAALLERFGDLRRGVPAEMLISFAGDRGYTFTVQEAEDELCDEALEGVAGGAGAPGVGPRPSRTASAGPLARSLPDGRPRLDVAYEPHIAAFTFVKVG